MGFWVEKSETHASNSRILKDIILEQKSRGKTIIFTTHNMHDASELCDRVAFIADGKIKALDTPNALCTGQSNSEVKYSFLQEGKTIEKSGILAQLSKDANFITALNNGSLTSIHSKEKTLEDVFISLTGRCLQ